MRGKKKRERKPTISKKIKLKNYALKKYKANGKSTQ
jgi:hypothetical protein